MKLMALAACHMLDDVRIQQSQTMSYVYLMLVQRLRRWPNIKPRWPSVSPLLGRLDGHSSRAQSNHRLYPGAFPHSMHNSNITAWT